MITLLQAEIFPSAAHWVPIDTKELHSYTRDAKCKHQRRQPLSDREKKKQVGNDWVKLGGWGGGPLGFCMNVNLTFTPPNIKRTQE